MPEVIRRNTVGDALRRTARVHRNAVAISFHDRVWRFAEIDAGASRIARHFADLGLLPGDRIAAYARNSDAYLLVWLGCVRGGFVHVPVNYALTGDELAYIVRQSGARMVVVADSLRDNMAGIAAEYIIPIDSIIGIAQDTRIGDCEDPDLHDDSLAQIVYTSGTTAAPKGAMMTHKAMLAQYYSTIHHFEYKRTDKALAALPLYHTAQMHAFTMPQFLVGAHTRIIEAPVPAQVLELIEREKITSFFAPPTVWISLLRHPDFATRDLASMRNIYYGASIMPVPVQQELRQRLPGAAPQNPAGG
jgi:fatty-acyl-CoA synthase